MTLSCPKGWTLHSSHCYMTTDQDSLPQQDADRYCQFLGGQLPAPTSLDMQQFLWNFSHAYRWDIWLPLTRRWASPDDPTGWWVWEGGDNVTWSNWYPHRPDPGEAFNCSAMWWDNGWWYDAP